MTHTPGPWIVSGIRHKWRNSYSDQQLDSHAVGPDGDAQCLVFYTPKYHAEQLANAKLISAAPELLEALNEALNGLLWYQDMHPEHYSRTDDEMITKIKRIISKATGEKV